MEMPVEKFLSVLSALEDFYGALSPPRPRGAFEWILWENVAYPADDARRSKLTRFPAIGKPGAEKILLLTGAHPVLALDSNGLRVLLRLGFGSEQGSYDAQYRSVQEPLLLLNQHRNIALLAKAHRLLQHHGRQLCKRNQPICLECPISRSCEYYTG